MLFSTPFFLFVFLPIFFALYWVLGARRRILLLGSAVFYAWSEPTFIFVVVASALADFLLGRYIATPESDQRRRKWLLGAGIANNLGLLLYVKYFAFGVGNVNTVLGLFGGPQYPIPQIALPLGVSFIVFEKITYLVDLYRGVAQPAVSVLDYLNYVFLFPKLLAGPIVKYHDIAAQLANPSHRYDDFRDGLLRFIQGLGKKVLIADSLSPFADKAFSLTTSTLDPASAWLGLVCFTLQIYYDFSGYSDMAIGLGRILGFRLLENFNQPYLATSFTDFWRRWHISLSTWIKEYLYISLGGNRVSTARSYANLCICFLISGLWHGASWNYIIWGSAHGVALVADRAWWLQHAKKLPRGVNILITLPLVMLTWVFFRCPSFVDAIRYFKALAGLTTARFSNAEMPGNDVWFMLVVGVTLAALPLIKVRRSGAEPALAPSQAHRLAALLGCAALLFLSVARMTVSSFHPFLYFRF